MPLRSAETGPSRQPKETALLRPDFAATGLLPPHPPTVPITRFQVVGERSSGTNFVTRLLARNSALKSSQVLGWKHGFPQADAIPADLAVICVVRRADAWALSMHRKPWHARAELQALPFDGFLRAPWDSIVDTPRYFRGLANAGAKGAPLRFDRNPADGAMFANLFALRRAKLAAMLGYLGRDCTALLLCMETAQAAPEATVDALIAALRLPRRSAAFVPIRKRLGSKFNAAITDRPETPQTMDADSLAFLRTQLDLRLEAQLGYTYA